MAVVARRHQPDSRPREVAVASCSLRYFRLGGFERPQSKNVVSSKSALFSCCGLLQRTGAWRGRSHEEGLATVAPRFRAILTIASGMGVLMTRCGLQFAFSEKHR